MADLFTAVGDFLNGVLTILNVFLLPTDPTGVVDWTLLPDQPMKLMIWTALIFLFLPLLYNFLIGMVRKARSGANG